MSKLIIIDTFGFFFRSFYALPPLKNAQGFPTGLLTGFANLIMKLYQQNPNDYIVFALEGGGQSVRKNLYSAYKENRQPTPQELLLQLPIAIQWIDAMQLTRVSLEGYEADDIIASLVAIAKREHIHTQIISHDKDLYQLIDEMTCLLDPVRYEEIHHAECEKKFGIPPRQFIDYQSLVGDTSDNVPGIKGIGAKTACKLLQHFGSLEQIYAREHELEHVLSAKLANAVREQKEYAFLSKKLVTLIKDLPLTIQLSSLRMPEQNPLLAITKELKQYGFIKILKRILGEPLNKKHTSMLDASISNHLAPPSHPSNNPAKSSQFSFRAHTLWSLADIKHLLAPLSKDTLIAYDCETTNLDVKEASLVGFSFCFDGNNAYYVPVAHAYLGAPKQLCLQDAKIALEMIFAFPVIGHNIKYDIAIAKYLGITPQREIYDSMIMAWLYDSNGKVGLDEQMRKWFAYEMCPFSRVLGDKKDFSYVSIEDATPYATEDAAASFALYHALTSKLISKGLANLLTLAKEVEFPFIHVLVAMESAGFHIDIEHFQALLQRFSNELASLEQEIFTLCNSSFNLNSPKQLATMLFETLGLRAQRQIKGGYSTDERTLQALIDAHPVIPKILEYREASKLNNTYVKPLLQHHHKGKIYTSFLQTGTHTGRLSSKNPNLQNIPVRSEQGKLIRQGFRAKSQEYTLLSIDYSQIELRLLAHFSNDKALIDAFHKGLDIHLQTAEILFSKEHAQEKRAIAKSINFGLIYGMGARKLSQTLHISFKEAKDYIQQYFHAFPSVKDFLHTKEQEILNQGYAETLLGRRRYFDFSHATELLRANYLREGINTIFQGSAADLIKMAMLRIQDYIAQHDITLLVQVHDELIFELPKDHAKQCARNIAHIMDTIYPLAVPLESSISIGDNWAALK